MKSIIIKCKIGNIDVSNKAIESLNVDRNFTDVSNKFSMTFIDTPTVSDAQADLEMYMNAGGRSISFSYGDTVNNLISFKGTIWDYQNTFVGDLKKLQITGYVTKADYLQNESGNTWAYNIDWNNYINMRADLSKPWNIMMQQERSDTLASQYQSYKNQRKSVTTSDYNAETGTIRSSTYSVSGVINSQQMSDILDSTFKSLMTYNTKFIKVKGPSGTIELPVPTSFVVYSKTSVVGKDSDSNTNVNFIKRACSLYYHTSDVKYWLWDSATGWKSISESAALGADSTVYISTATENSTWPIIGFIDNSDAYIEVRMNKSYAGAGMQIKNPFGVSPSDIVRQLATLEGWTIGNIVDTELVTCSDTFKMSDQSALDFITNNLVPVSVMPSGVVTLKNGTTQVSSSGTGGYVPYFMDGKFYYEPLNASHLIDRTGENLYLGYNIKNSPVISFQVDTKGTVFYTVQPIKISAMDLVTGKENTTVETTSTAAINNYNKVAGHNEGVDSFFGYSYDEVESDSKIKSIIEGLWDSGDYTYKNSTININSNPYEGTSNTLNIENPQYILNSSQYDDALVSTLAIQATTSEAQIRAKLEEAKEKIRTHTVLATLSMWGNTRVTPASIVKITNMVKMENKLYPSEHPTSGNYLITKQTDRIDSSGFIQNLSMYRYTESLQSALDSTNIDWSKGISTYQANLKIETREGNFDINQDNFNTPPVGYVKIGKFQGKDVYADKKLTPISSPTKFYIIGIGFVERGYTTGFATWLEDMLNETNDVSNTYNLIGNAFYGLNYNSLGKKTLMFYQADPNTSIMALKQKRVYMNRTSVPSYISSSPPTGTVSVVTDSGAITDLYCYTHENNGSNVLSKITSRFWHKDFGWLNYVSKEGY